MDLATGAMASLLPKLAELLYEEYKLQTGVKKDVEFLEREMKSMDVALRKVASVPREKLDEQVKIWANDVRQLSYKMEDVIDNFLVRVEGSKLTLDPNRSKGHMKKMTNLIERRKSRHQIAEAIKDIKDQVQEVAARRDRYKIDDAGGNPSTTTTTNIDTATMIDPRILALFKDHRELVGINKPRNELIKRLTEGDALSNSNQRQPLKILSIFGFGGIGKTTLAKAVYDKLLLKVHFDCKAFVSVGQNPSVKKVLMDILHEIDKDTYHNATMLGAVQLVRVLRRMLENKRYLIVIDDIWDIASWKIITSAWVDSSCGSTIIITTRILKVAKEITDHVYKHKPLSNDNSRELFFKRLSNGKGKNLYDQSSAKISEKILQKCGGVPLAIITIASLLANKPREDWSSVYDSIGFGHEDNIDVEFTRKILLYSYYDLPCYLRTCLLHLTIYPEDYEIHKNPLIWKWAAEGFIVHEKHGGVGLFELGERYFNELINRSMIQPVEEPHDGIIYACRVHDLVLDMINSLIKEENFVVVLRSSEEKYTCPDSNARRLAIQNRVIDEDDPLANTPMTQVRSFNTFMCHIEIMPSLLSFYGLRVLDLRGCTFMEDRPYHLDHLGKLLQLRYLGLSDMRITELPSEIGNLNYLQTLDLELMEIRELPLSIGMLSQLKCLHLPRNLTGILNKIRNLPSSLEELWLYRVANEFVEELDKLTELRELGIELTSLNADLLNDLMTCLSNLDKLQLVQISCSRQDPIEYANCEGYMAPRQLRHLYLYGVVFLRLPAWVDPSRLSHLTHLNLKVKTVEANDVEILGRFPELIWLWMEIENHVIFPHIVVGGAFPKLRYLYMPTMLTFLQGALPCLEYLSYIIDIGATIRELPWYEDKFPRYNYDFTDYGSLESDIDTIGNLPCLQELIVTVHNNHDMVKKMVRFAVKIHPRRPTLEIRTSSQDL